MLTTGYYDQQQMLTTGFCEIADRKLVTGDINTGFCDLDDRKLQELMNTFLYDLGQETPEGDEHVSLDLEVRKLQELMYTCFYDLENMKLQERMNMVSMI